MNLNEEERHKFADYLEQDAKSSRMLAEQMAKLGSIHQAMTKKLRIEADAAKVVATKLRSLSEL